MVSSDGFADFAPAFGTISINLPRDRVTILTGSSGSASGSSSIAASVSSVFDSSDAALSSGETSASSLFSDSAIFSIGASASFS